MPPTIVLVTTAQTIFPAILLTTTVPVTIVQITTVSTTIVQIVVLAIVSGEIMHQTILVTSVAMHLMIGQFAQQRTIYVTAVENLDIGVKYASQHLVLVSWDN